MYFSPHMLINIINYLDNYLNKVNVLFQISLIDPSLIGNKNGQICRFRGMVQDMPNPVFYFSKYEVRNKINGQTEVRSGKFMDTIQCSVSHLTVFMVPIVCSMFSGINIYINSYHCCTKCF